MNKKIYIWTIVISILLLIPASIWQHPILAILSGIGCSGIASSIMAMFLDIANFKKENAKKIRNRCMYFDELREQLKMMFERIIWFEDRMSEDFNWDNKPSIYSSFQYMIYAGYKYPESKHFSFQEIESKLDELKKKYSLENQSKMSKEQLQKTQKMFLSLYTSSLPLLIEVTSLKTHKIELDAEDYLPLSDTDTIYYQINLAISLMSKPQRNYGLAISLLLSAYKSICKVSNCSDDFSIGLHGTTNTIEI